MHQPIACFVTLLSLAVAVVMPAHAAEAFTKEQGDAILNELRQIRSVLERQPQAPSAPSAMPENNTPVKVDVKGAPTLGQANAPITIVAFTDYQCPFCKRFDTQTFPTLKKNYIDTGKVRYVIKDLPLDAIHPHAYKAAEATHCAADQGMFWQMRDKLVVNSEKLELGAIAAYAAEIGIKPDPFKACMDKGKHADTVRRSLAHASTLGIGGTPTFVVGKGNGDVITGVKMVGALPLEMFEQKMKELRAGN